MKNILVAVDFKFNEQLLIDMAAQFAQHFDSKIWLLHIASPDPDFVGYQVGPQYIRDNLAKQLRKEHRLLQEYTKTLKAKNVKAEGLLVQGGTIEMIIEESKKLMIDLIITGQSEHSLIYRVIFGNVSGEILKKSKIPVLIVPLD